MVSRIGSAAVGLPLLVLAIWAGSIWFAMLVAVAAAIGALEISHMSRRRGRRPMAAAAAAWAVALVATAHFVASGSNEEAVLPALAFTGIVVAVGGVVSWAWILRHSNRGLGLADWGITAGAALYPGWLLSHGPLLRALVDGREWVFLVVFVTFASDTAAFFGGRMFGRHPLASNISPGKTQEGAVAGLAAAAGMSAALAVLLDLDITVPAALVLGALMGVAGQLGDLAESRLKRAANVKDSGRLIPGHGGLLDRVDSIVFNLPLVYYFVVWVIQ